MPRGRATYFSFLLERVARLGITPLTMSDQDSLPPQLPQEPSASGVLGDFPPPSLETDRSWGIVLQASSLLGLLVPGLGHLLAPLIIWLIKRPESAYLDAVGKEVVNFQISYTLYGLAVAAIAVITCGFGAVLAIPLLIGWLVLVIMGIVKTSNGETYRFPFILRLVK